MLSRFLGECISLNDYLRSRVFAGILFMAPLIITLAVITWIYSTLADSLDPLFIGGSNRFVPVTTIAILLLAPLSVGLMLMFRPTRMGLRLMERGAQRVPFAGSIYRVGKDVSAAFAPGTELGFNRVVHIEYPRRGVWTLGFMTGTVRYDDDDREWAVVFMPTAPLPNSGWVAYLPIDEVYELDMTTSQAMQFTLSGGVVLPPRISRKKLAPEPGA